MVDSVLRGAGRAGDLGAFVIEAAGIAVRVSAGEVAVIGAIPAQIKIGLRRQSCGYECGSRALSVLGFVELCHVLNLSAPDVLACSVKRAQGVPVALHAVAGNECPELSPLRNWARARQRFTRPGQPIVTLVDFPAVARLAELCEIPAFDLVSALREMT